MKKTVLSLLVISILSCSILFVRKNGGEEIKNTVTQAEEENGDRLSGAAKQMNMWWWGRAYPDPANITAKYLRAWDHAVKMKDNKLFPTHGNGLSRTTAGAWNSIGPKTLGGRMLALGINPLRHRTLFA